MTPHVWAPAARRVRVVVPGADEADLHTEPGGWWAAELDLPHGCD